MNQDFSWHWIRDHRRKKILETEFPDAWVRILERNVAHFRRLSEGGRRELSGMIQVFVAEKHWEGCGGLVLTDEIRVTVAAQACLMILALNHDLFPDVDSIFIYPSTVMTPERPVGFFEMPQAPVRESVSILGEAQMRGPVILVWDAVLQTARHPEKGHNVVYHEFAHKLDMLDGRVDGTPPLGSPEQYRSWVEVCSREFLRLRAITEKGERTFLESYGAVNEAEFFAVITEQFFGQPTGLKKHHPELYGVLSDFYQQDPAELD
ncbi:MAG: zinc-dependent peptidase [Methylotenera sp.]|nr:zinc-dependent peptidase [Oligoflexia bacterium]